MIGAQYQICVHLRLGFLVPFALFRDFLRLFCFLCFSPLRLCVRFFGYSLASVLIPFGFFLQEAYRFFHRRAGNDRNLGRIMELTDDR